MGSLLYFKPQYMSLQKPHPLFSTAAQNPFEINKSLVVAKMLSGRYRSDWHCRHWSTVNRSGDCLLCPGKNFPGTLEHMLVLCPALEQKRSLLKDYLYQETSDKFDLKQLFDDILQASTHEVVQFLLDPSVVPRVIAGCQTKVYFLPEIFRLTRTYCYGLHRRRLQLIGRFNYRT